MAELKSIIETHFPMPKRQPGKRWKIAQTRGTDKQQAMRNDCIEASYHEVIKSIKQLYMQDGEVFFERDYKHDRSDFLAMHCILTSSFYWRLDCALYYDFEIAFAFSNCPYEAEIRAMLRAFPLDRSTTERTLNPEFNTFYNTVLKVQSAEAIFCFKR
jgi:hypothetical protein